MTRARAIAMVQLGLLGLLLTALAAALGGCLPPGPGDAGLRGPQAPAVFLAPEERPAPTPPWPTAGRTPSTPPELWPGADPARPRDL